MKKILFLLGLIRKVKGVYSLIGQVGIVVLFVYEQVFECGVIGVVVDIWMKYEVIVKFKMVDLFKYVNRVFFLNVFVLVIYMVGIFIVLVIFSWFSKYSEF